MKTSSMFISGAAPPTISGGTTSSLQQSAPLLMYATQFTCECMGLFIETEPVTEITNSLPMSIYGGDNAIVKAVPLIIFGSGIAESMNLVIGGTSSGANVELMNLVITGIPENALNGIVPLFMAETPILTLNTALYIEGTGTNAGFSPSSEDVGLYISRDNSWGITLHVENREMGMVVPLIIGGQPDASLTADLFVEGFGGDITLIADLFVDGKEPNSVDNQADLIIPSTSAVMIISTPLYTNGFRYQ